MILKILLSFYPHVLLNTWGQFTPYALVNAWGVKPGIIEIVFSRVLAGFNLLNNNVYAVSLARTHR